jgi:flagellar motility protein MotE (MotC chaperone)
MAKTSKKSKAPTVARAARFRLMPLTLIMLSLVLVLKLNDVWMGTQALRPMLIASAQAEEKPAEEAKSEAPADEKKADKKASAEQKPAEEEKTLGAGKRTVKEIEALKAKQSAPETSAVEKELLQSLGARREAIEKREADLALKATMLEATEGRINDRIEEMKKLKLELQNVLKQYEGRQDDEIRGLVKIYENMKPINAAVIFNELDMPILLSVIDKMSERKVAPVIAAMDPKRAKEVTEQLAEMRKLRAMQQQKAASLAADGEGVKPLP